jgi:DNA replication licensing factor MCM2
LLPSSPVHFFSEQDRHDIVEEDIVDDGFGDENGSDDDGIDLFKNMEA